MSAQHAAGGRLSPEPKGEQERRGRRAPGDVAAASWDALPFAVLQRIASHLAGDVPALCAVTCVSRAWQSAAAAPQLWARLAQLPTKAAQRLNDARLAWLVARAEGALERLNVRGARLISDSGLKTALQQRHALSAFFADSECCKLTGRGVARALAARRGLMRELSVRGLDCGPHKPQDGSYSAEERWVERCAKVTNDLRALMAPNGSLDGEKTCQDDDSLCGELCGRCDMCSHCDKALCPEHQDGRFRECMECREQFCADQCIQSAACDSCCVEVNERHRDFESLDEPPYGDDYY